MRNLIITAAFIVVAIVLYVIWGSLNSRLIAIESTTGSYLYGEDIPAGDTGGSADLAPLLDRLAAIENIQAENTAAIAALRQRVEQLEARETGYGGQIISREIIYFDFNDATLSIAGEEKIDRLLEGIEGKAFVSLIGHADTSGDNSYNQLLSLRRAAAVKRYIDARLLAGGESDKLLLSITGAGEEAAIKATGEETRERSNRSVEILVFQ
ncbi:MAG: OmpA family protein [Gammaproteobacteria bacterium]|jgi:outer membrane protein OmpA-like peptidoglycan-associated protein